jgi:hypothetical protein
MFNFKDPKSLSELNFLHLGFSWVLVFMYTAPQRNLKLGVHTVPFIISVQINLFQNYLHSGLIMGST